MQGRDGGGVQPLPLGPYKKGVFHRDAIFPDFSGIPDFHKSKLSKKNL